jgi:succinate dehydrogenase / fumarate reductase cytochrome b subunit
MGSGHSFYSSTIGKKVIVAGTGFFLILFVIVHMLGNLQMFAGQDAVNGYAKALKSFPVLLWTARIGLLVFFVLHAVTAFQLKRLNQAARPDSYANFGTVQATVSSRIMAFTGAFVLLYVIGHLLHFTLGVLLPENFARVDSQGRHDVYSMVVLGFLDPAVSLIYIAAMLILFSHLRHGISSLFQTAGFHHARYTPVIEILGPALAALIVLGYISIPLGVLAGVIRLPGIAG